MSRPESSCFNGRSLAVARLTALLVPISLLLLVVFLTMTIVPPARACTSFMLQSGDDIYFVHSINQGSMPSIDGAAYFNPRDTWKNGHSFANLFDPGSEAAAELVWKSTYGSVTFSPLGLEFPDGGLNEAGLFIWEMGFDPEYPTDESLPVLFQMQWMQYQLDNFADVDEVIEHLDRVALDGWGWHYFIADKSGNAAIIDYTGGRPVVTTDDALPIPLCCNSEYSVAMDWLRKHEGFGGELPIEQGFDEIPRFIYGAKLMRDFSDQDPVAYGFKILDDMSVNVRWSIVFDVTRGEAHFKTNLDQGIRSFKFEAKDFAPDRAPLMLDINSPGPADVRDRFVSHDPASDRVVLAKILQMFLEDGGDPGPLADKMLAKIQYGHDATAPDLVGKWTGTTKVPAAGDTFVELPTSLTLDGQVDRLTGRISIEGMASDAAISNLEYEAGLLGFTVHTPGKDDRLQFRLFMSGDGIRGGAGTWDWNNRKTALVHLERTE